MTSLRNISTSDSAVYRSIYQRPQEDHLLDSVGSEAAEEETSKWAFLKRLLEIEEAHDRRRRTREKQDRVLKQATLKPLTGTASPSPAAAAAAASPSPASPSPAAAAAAAAAYKMVKPSTERIEIDHTAKWLSGQVLMSDAPDIDTSENGDKEPASSRLPPVFGHLPPHTSKSVQELNHPPMMKHDVYPAISRKAEHNQSLFSTPDTKYFDAGNQLGHSNHEQHVSMTDLKNSFYSLSSSDQRLNTNQGDSYQSSLHSFKRGASRPTSAPKKHRQLRLPPILLPRIYTVQPRPLKALEFPVPTKLPGPITEAQWEDLRDCRYIRHISTRRSLNL